jgi:S-DNA-T family DNA segregation ATPase FtsK/SpoIIIE
MARRSRPGGNRPAAVGLGLLLVALLLALSFLPRATGVPLLLAAWQRRALGLAAPLLPVYMAVAGLVLIAAGSRARVTRRVSGIALGTAAAIMLVHARTAPGDLLQSGLMGAGTGVAGGASTWLVARVLGLPGLWATIGVMGALAVGFVGGVSLADLGAALHAAGRLAKVLAAVAVRLVARAAVAAGKGLARAAREMIARGRPAVGGLARSARSLAARIGAEAATQAGRLPAALAMRQATIEPAPAMAGPVDAAPVDAPRRRSAAPAPEPARGPGEAAGAGSGEAMPEAKTARRRARADAPRAGGPAAPVTQQRLDFAARDYQLPPLSLLGDPGAQRGRARVDPADTARALEQTLESFGVEAKVVHWEVGPVVTRFELQPAAGVKVQKITSLHNDIALNLAAQSVRIEAPIPGKSAVGIELPNQKSSLVHLREILASDLFQKATSPLVTGVGKDIAGHPIIANLAEMPHLLIAGATGSGKSVMLNAMIASLLFRGTPHQVRFVMIDPKRVELTDYNDIPHLLTPVVTNPRQAASVLKDMLRVMEKRFERFAEAGVRNIQAFNQLTDVEPMYYIVIIIDELADLMMVAPADFEDIICRLAQMTRATGIHLVVATQRPSVDVVTGLIKANIPSRLAFAVSSQVDSRTILDQTGAEKLLGRGDMLFLPLGASRAVRAQGAYIGDDEIRAVVEWWRKQGAPVYDQQLVEAQQSAGADEGGDGERLIEAARLCIRSGYGSVSLLQRKMRIGYVTAARLIDELEARGVVGPVQGSNPREVLIGLDELDRLMRSRQPAAKE